MSQEVFESGIHEFNFWAIIYSVCAQMNRHIEDI